MDQAGEEMQFRVKKDTKMQKIFDSYAQRKGIPANSIRFLFEDKRILGDYTPKMLELEDGDQVDAMCDFQMILCIVQVIHSYYYYYLLG